MQYIPDAGRITRKTRVNSSRSYLKDLTACKRSEFLSASRARLVAKHGMSLVIQTLKIFEELCGENYLRFNVETCHV